MNSDDVVELVRNDGVSCSVHLFGATVISWKCKNQERIFVSSKSLFDKKKAIRGGVPVVFPNFGPWELGPQHGFARVCMWTLHEKPHVDKDKNVVAVFSLEDNETTRKMWDHKFKLLYTLTLRENELQFDFLVTNTGKDAFDFTCLLHTYFKLPDIQKLQISGLRAAVYFDKVNEKNVTEDRELVTICDNVDSVYANTSACQTLTLAGSSEVISMVKRNLPDTVVWNPWKEKAVSMSDFGDDEYKQMACVEAGHVTSRVELAPGKEFLCGQTLTIK